MIFLWVSHYVTVHTENEGKNFGGKGKKSN